MSEGELSVDCAAPAGAAAVGLRAWRFRGGLQVTVAAKATFAFAPEAPMVRVAPREIVRDEIHHGNSPGRSIRLSTDLAPYLARAEVFFTGHAYLPPGGASESVPVRLGIFDGARVVLAKSVHVRRRAGVLKVPLVYELAYGGVGWPDNVVGTGVSEGSDVPSVFDPVDPKRLAGFGPIGQYWPARKKLLGPQQSKALKLPIAVIADDFDWSYFQAAPADQWTDFLRGDEWIVMDGLHPSLPRTRMRLPGARGLARVHGLSEFGIVEGQPLTLHADMLRIDGDEQQCSLTFRGTFPLPGEDALRALRVVAGVELPNDPLVWFDPPALRGGAPARPSAWKVAADTPTFAGTLTLEDEDIVSEAPAPMPAAPAQPAAAHQAARAKGRPTAVERRTIDPYKGLVVGDAAPPLGRTMAERGESRRPRTLPFKAGIAVSPAVAKPAASPSPARKHSLTGTMAEEPSPEVRPARRTLPFGQNAPVVPAPEKANLRARLAVEEAPLEIAPRPAPAPPAETRSEAEKPSGSPWAPAPPPPEPPAPRAPPPPPAQPAASPALKKGLYGKFGGKR